MDFAFTAEQEQLRNEGLALAGLAPSSPPSPNTRIDPGVLAALAAKGVAAAALPARYGGRGLDIGQVCALWEGLGQGTADAALALALSTDALLTAVPLWKLGTEPQRRRYLPRVAAGEWVGALSLHELAGGSSPAARGVRVTAAAGGRWRLDGVKAQVVNGSSAHHFVLTAVTGDQAVSAFVLDRDTPGLRVEPSADGLDRLVLDGAVVPRQALLGVEGAAHRELLPLLLALYATASLAPWLGVMRAVTDRALSGALAGTAFDRPVQRFQNVRFALADMGTRCELSSGLLYKAAWQLDEHQAPGRQDYAVTALFVAQSAQSVVEDATRVLALAGQFPDPVVGRAARDVAWLRHTAGGEDVLRSTIAGSLVGLG